MYNDTEIYGMLIFGQGIFYSGISDPVEDVPNVNYDWYELPAIKDKMNSFQEVGLTENFSGMGHINHGIFDSKDMIELNNPEKFKIGRWTSNGIKCDVRMFVSFTASRDIRIGEKLVLPLMVDSLARKKYTSLHFANACL